MYVHMLKLCSVELPRALGRLHLLAKPIKHAKIHQLRQEPPYACHCLRPCTRAENPRERQLTMHGKDETGSRGPAAVRSIAVLVSASISSYATSTTRWTRCSR
jgi:hypothetical protein